MSDSESQSSTSAPSAGSLLKQAREAKGMTVADIAAELHLDIKTVEALDADNADKLPAPIFVRGYIKSYARRVGLDEHQVLSAYQPPVVEEEPQPIRKKSSPSLSLPIGPLIGLMVALVKKLFLLLIVVALAWGAYKGYQLWQQRSFDVDIDAEQLDLPGQDVDSYQENGQSQILLPTEPLAPEDPINLSEPEVSAPTKQAEPLVTVAPPPVVEAENRVSVVLRYGAESWTEIRDSDGKKLVFGLIQPGTTRTFTAVPPIQFVIGNAESVELEVDGQRFDHSGYNRNNVARFRIDN